MIRIAFIGAGSLDFTGELVRDILTFPLLEGATLSLMDIDAERLAWAKKGVEKLIAAGNRPAKVEATLERASERFQFLVQLLARERRDVPEVDLPALVSGARLFVFPSVHEGFGLPPLEAMQCGTPVACARVSALSEVTGDAAFPFDPFNVPGMSTALSHLLEDADLRAELADRGLRRAQLFTWERTARETMAAYLHKANP